MEDNEERRHAELVFIHAAYTEDEAWVTTEGGITVHRRCVASPVFTNDAITFLLRLEMKGSYPSSGCLDISGTVEEARTGRRWVKQAYIMLPSLLNACREIAVEMEGQEAVFPVLNRAEEWLVDELPNQLKVNPGQEKFCSWIPAEGEKVGTSGSLVLSRKLMYSHHIISRVKRSDMKSLAAELELTGFIKIGWPGVIIVEGLEMDCQSFYDQIRQWAWKHLVMRGEVSELCSDMTDLQCRRLFKDLQEVDDMSIVAAHCREVGLENLFKTSMKIYESEQGNLSNETLYGALVHVDHMNNGKLYRKWLKKTCSDAGATIMILQHYPNDDVSAKPLILVGITGPKETVSSVFKRWRTSRVDVDSTGKPCLERMMSVLTEGQHDKVGAKSFFQESIEDLNLTEQGLIDSLKQVGIESWLIEGKAKLQAMYTNRKYLCRKDL